MNIGKVPNFILFDKYETWLSQLLFTVRGFHLIQGVITSNNDLLNYVNWGLISNYTSGKFCFPLESSGQITLSPTSPGYEILPKTVKITSPVKKHFINEFKARSLKIEDNLELYLPFDNSIKNLSNKRIKSSGENIEFVMDPIRGAVSSLTKESYISLPSADVMHMQDQDFTVSAWVKIPRFLPEKSDYTILGSKSGRYQSGLHLLIREKKPYMGFFNNDLAGKTTLEAGKWYNLTWRYNKTNGEQAIFVDGKLDAISANRPAYLGNDSLYVGIFTANNPEFIGLLDNLCIWSRVLSDKEIKLISNQMVEFNLSLGSRIYSNLPMFITIAAVIILLLLALLLYYLLNQKRKREKVFSQLRDEVFREAPEKNYIKLFGDFYVTDRDGNNITALLTPKLKQLFLLILTHSLQHQSGISSSDLTKIIWGEDSSKSTKSLRSVSILKLRKILEKIDKVDLVFNTNKYSIIFSEEVYCDYLVCLEMLRSNQITTGKEFDKFFDIINNGEIFKEESFDWLDDFKGDICNSIVDVLSRFIGEYSLTEDTEKIIRIANQILLNDPSNEEALVYKVKALAHQNNTKSAKHAYKKFCSLYQDMYGEDFSKSFDDILSTSME